MVTASRFVCIDFHRPEWIFRRLGLYYVKLDTGQLFLIRAYDAVDAVEAIAGNVVEYGNLA